MIWLLPFLFSGAILWANRGALRAAFVPTPPPVYAPPLQLRSSYGGPALLGAPSPYLMLPPPSAPPYAGDVDGSSIYATGTPYSSSPPYTGQTAMMPEGTYVPSPFASPPPPAFATSAPALFAPPPQAAPIAALRCAMDGCPIRPEPRAWDDVSLGRMPGSFTAPRDYPVYVLSFGPVGWAHVLVNHPDEGAVEGWIETRNLAEESAMPSFSPGTPATPATATGALSADALARHVKFMKERGGNFKAVPPGTAVASSRKRQQQRRKVTAQA